MKTLLRNFIAALRRFSTATLLNIVGLSIAFASFIIICMQVEYDLNFDHCHPGAERIYRVNLISKGVTVAIIPRPLGNTFTNSSPHIKAGAVVNCFTGNKDLIVESENGERSYFTEDCWRVEPGFTEVFTFHMHEGSDQALKDPGQILISRSLAKKFFGDQRAVGKRIISLPERTSWTVGGVYNDFPDNSQIRNLIYYPLPEKENIDDWGNSNYLFYFRVDDPANIPLLVENYKRVFEATLATDELTLDELEICLTPLKDTHFSGYVAYDPTPKTSYQTLLVLLVIAIAILLIAAINFTNFSTSLAPVRVKSINTQKVLGAGQSALQLALVMEAVIVSFLAYLFSLLLVYIASKTMLGTLVNTRLSLINHPLLVAGTALLSVLTGAVAGSYPAFYITSFSPAVVLKGNFGLSPKGKTVRNILIGFQFVASFVLIIASLVMFLQNHYIQTSSLGYEKEEVIIADMTKTLNQHWNSLENQLKSYPGIEDVTRAEFLLSSNDKYMNWGREYRGENITFQCLPVDYSFLKVMGIELTGGRDFRKEDELQEKGIYIFNEEARHTYKLEAKTKVEGNEIIGFMTNTNFASFRTAIEPMAFYLRPTHLSDFRFLYIKTTQEINPFETLTHIKDILNTLDPEYIKEPYFFDEVMNQLYQKEQNLTWLITLFSLLAIFISIVGVFGLVIFESEYRRKEIGVRKVLGSSTLEILLMFNKIYMNILVICFIIALPIAWYGINKWLENFAYKTPVYWWIYAVAFLLVAAVTALTVTYQNWQTANQNPVESLKNE